MILGLILVLWRKKLHTLGVDVNINEVPNYGSQYLQDQALRSQYTKLQKMMEQFD
jgi:hypothetical protein